MKVLCLLIAAFASVSALYQTTIATARNPTDRKSTRLNSSHNA